MRLCVREAHDAVQLVKDIEAREVLATSSVFLEHHGILRVLIDGFPLLFRNANGASYRLSTHQPSTGSGPRLDLAAASIKAEGQGSKTFLPSVMLSHASSTSGPTAVNGDSKP